MTTVHFVPHKCIWNIWTRIKWEAKLTNLSEIFGRGKNERQSWKFSMKCECYTSHWNFPIVQCWLKIGSPFWTKLGPRGRWEQWVTHLTNIISGSFFLCSWSQEVISIMPEFPAKKILIFEFYSLILVNWFRFLWTHSMILLTQFCIDSKTKKKVISDNKKSLKWLSDKHASILWFMNSGQEDIAVLFQRASCIYSIC